MEESKGESLREKGLFLFIATDAYKLLCTYTLIYITYNMKRANHLPVVGTLYYKISEAAGVLKYKSYPFTST